MISPFIKAARIKERHKERNNALVSAQMCLFMCKPSQRVYWEEVLTKLEELYEKKTEISRHSTGI